MPAHSLSAENPDSTATFSLRGLQLKLNNAGDVAPHMEEFERRADDITHLCLSGNTLASEAVSEFAPALGRLKRLKAADFSDIFTSRLKPDVTKSMGYLCHVLKELPQLEEVDFSDNALGEGGARAIAVLLAGSTSLSVLRLNNTGLGIIGGKIVAEGLKQCPKAPSLREFTAGRNRLEDEGTRALAQSFRVHGSSLEMVSLFHNGIRPIGIQDLFLQGLAYCPNLLDIDLQDNSFKTAGSLALARCIPLWPKISKIQVSDCLLKSQGASAIFRVLLRERVKSLSDLGIEFNEIDCSTVEILAKWVEVTRGGGALSRLRLNGNRVDDDSEVVERIRRVLRHEGKDELQVVGEIDEPEELDSGEEHGDEDDEHVWEIVDGDLKVFEAVVATKEDKEVEALAEAIGKVNIQGD